MSSIKQPHPDRYTVIEVPHAQRSDRSRAWVIQEIPDPRVEPERVVIVVDVREGITFEGVPQWVLGIEVRDQAEPWEDPTSGPLAQYASMSFFVGHEDVISWTLAQARAYVDSFTISELVPADTRRRYLDAA